MLKKNQTETMLEMKNSVSQIKGSVESLTNRKDCVENGVSGPKEKTEESNRVIKVNDK